MKPVHQLMQAITLSFLITLSVIGQPNLHDKKAENVTCLLKADEARKPDYEHVMVIEVNASVRTTYREQVNPINYDLVSLMRMNNRICNIILYIGRYLEVKLFGQNVYCRDTMIYNDRMEELSTLIVYVPVEITSDAFTDECVQWWQTYYSQKLSNHIEYILGENERRSTITVRNALDQIHVERGTFHLMKNKSVLVQNPWLKTNDKIAKLLTYKWMDGKNYTRFMITARVEHQTQHDGVYNFTLVFSRSNKDAMQFLANHPLSVTFTEYFQNHTFMYQLANLKKDEALVFDHERVNGIMKPFTQPVTRRQNLTVHQQYEVEYKIEEAVAFNITLPTYHDTTQVSNTYQQLMTQHIGSFVKRLSTMNGTSMPSYKFTLFYDKQQYSGFCNILIQFEQPNSMELRNRVRTELETLGTLFVFREFNDSVISVTETTCVLSNFPRYYIDWTLRFDAVSTEEPLKRNMQAAANKLSELLRYENLTDCIISSGIINKTKHYNRIGFTVYYLVDMTEAVQRRQEKDSRLLYRLNHVASELQAFLAEKQITITADTKQIFQKYVCTENLVPRMTENSVHEQL